MHFDMKILINDANILIDLVKIELINEFSNLDLIYTQLILYLRNYMICRKLRRKNSLIQEKLYS